MYYIHKKCGYKYKQCFQWFLERHFFFQKWPSGLSFSCLRSHRSRSWMSFVQSCHIDYLKLLKFTLLKKQTNQQKTEFNEDTQQMVAMVMHRWTGHIDHWLTWASMVGIDVVGFAFKFLDVCKVAVWPESTVWCSGSHTVKSARCPGEAARSGSTWTLAM